MAQARAGTHRARGVVSGRRRFDGDHCPVARTTDLIGDWWTPLILRELCTRRTTFSEIQDDLGLSRATLANRLKRMESEGVVDRVEYQTNPSRHRYELTAKGRALWDVVAVMWRYGDEWLFSDGAIVELLDKRSGVPIRPRVIDENTGENLDLASTRVRLRSHQR